MQAFIPSCNVTTDGILLYGCYVGEIIVLKFRQQITWIVNHNNLLQPRLLASSAFIKDFYSSGLLPFTVTQFHILIYIIYEYMLKYTPNFMLVKTWRYQNVINSHNITYNLKRKLIGKLLYYLASKRYVPLRVTDLFADELLHLELYQVTVPRCTHARQVVTKAQSFCVTFKLQCKCYFHIVTRKVHYFGTQFVIDFEINPFPDFDLNRKGGPNAVNATLRSAP